MNTEYRMAFFLFVILHLALLWLIFFSMKKWLVRRLMGSFAFLKYDRPVQGYEFFEVWPRVVLECPQVFLRKLLKHWTLSIASGLLVSVCLLVGFIKGLFGIEQIANEGLFSFALKAQLAVVVIAYHYHSEQLVNYQAEAEERYQADQAMEERLWAVKQRLWDLAESDDEEDDWWRQSKD